MPTSNQSETIDPRILRLIGLEDVFDLDYETYLTLLKEVMVKSRMIKKTIPTEEIMLLDEEYKRVKTKKDKGRFKVKTKKITAKSFTIGGKQLPGSKATKALPGTAIGKSSISKSLDQNIAAITSSVVSIAEMMRQQAGLASEEAAYDRRRSEQQRRAVSENKLEKRFEGLKKAAEKIIAPVKGILDKIFGFLVKVFFGRVLYKLIEWFGDPKNAGKVKSVIRFLGDWWPALLGAYIIFGNSFGRFTTKIIFTVARFGVQLATKAIPGLIALARRNPATAALALGATTYLTNQALNSSEPTQQLAGGGYVRPRKFRGGGLASLKRFFGLDGGGYPGYVSGQKGVDKIPAMLSDGEFVMSRGAVQMYGSDTLSAMNAAGGGTNRPKIMSGTTYAQGGGLMGGMPNPDPNYKDPLLSARDGLMRELENYARSQVSVGGNSNLIKALNDVALSLKGQGGSVSSGGFRIPGLPSGGGFAESGNQVLNSLQSNFNTVRETAKNVLGSVDKLGTGEGYKRMSQQNEKKNQEAVSKYDAWVQSLPKGFLRDTMNRGLIPIPTGNELGMTGLTYIKAMLGPLGRPFRILSNEKVDKARQEMIDRTAAANGLMVGPDGKMSMSWNRVSGRGSGQYTDEFAALGGSKTSGKFFNSTFGRWSGRQQGNRMVTDDVYNFNESVGYYAGKSRDALMKGNVGEGLYNIASMAGKFAQDIGWMNQRALGSEIDVGSVKNIDSRTGKPKTPQQIAAGRARFTKPKQVKTLPVKPPVRSTTVMQGQTAVTLYGKNDPRRNTRRSGSKPPRFNASTNGSRTKTETLGLMR